MVNPFRSEADAYRIALGTALGIGVCLALGALVAPAAGYGAAAGLVAAALAFVVVRARERPVSLHEAELASHPDHVGRRILVLADEPLLGAVLRDELVHRGHAELVVVAPVLPSRAHYWADDIDAEASEARRRLEATLAWARENGFEAEGDVDDADPLTALEDGLRRFGADEVVVALHPRESPHWLERGLLEEARRQLDAPVTAVFVDPEGGRVEVEPELTAA